MHLALYRSERPERFDEIIGQKHIVKILQNQLKTGTVSQAYLFTGTRGTGKTTTARILAKAVNCIGEPSDGVVPCGECENCRSIREGNFLDVIELDAASNNGVDDLRNIIETVNYPPSIGKYKVYIIDEVHMLSTSAENAFLKTLEEPPEYAIFILATTNPEKVRATIRSRCMTLSFQRVSENELVEGMRRIVEKKGIQMTEEALSIVAQRADGSVRDGLSILEQCISGGDEIVTEELVLDYIGSAGLSFYLRLTEAVTDNDISSALTEISSMVREGKDAKQMISDWLAHYRDLMVVKYLENPKEVVNASPENIERLRHQAKRLDASELEKAIRTLSEYTNLGRYSTQPRILLETAALHLMNGAVAEAPSVRDLPKEAPPGAARPSNTDRPVDLGGNRTFEPRRTESSRSVATRDVTESSKEDNLPLNKNTNNLDSAGTDGFAAMWERYSVAMTDELPLFPGFFGTGAGIISYKNGELLIGINSKSKLGLAERNSEIFNRVAKNLFGEDTFVQLRLDSEIVARPGSAGRVESTPKQAVQRTEESVKSEASRPPEAPLKEAVSEHYGQGEIAFTGGEDDVVDVPDDYYYSDEDVSDDDEANRIAENASALFGVSVNVVDN